MLILVVEPEKLPKAREITGSLQEMQEIVGGMIQVLYPFPGEEIALVCNDEGKLLGLELNRGLRDGIGNLILSAGHSSCVVLPLTAMNFTV